MFSVKEIIGSMPYREAQAWIFVIVNAIVATTYGFEVIGNESLPAFAGLIIVAVCTSFYTIILIIPTAIIFNRSANDGMDERDKRIRAEAGGAAFCTLLVMTGASLGGYVFHSNGDLLFHTILLTILLAHFVYALSTAVKYRRSGAPVFMTPQD